MIGVRDNENTQRGAAGLRWCKKRPGDCESVLKLFNSGGENEGQVKLTQWMFTNSPRKRTRSVRGVPLSLPL
jgi:hypothetical protein